MSVKIKNKKEYKTLRSYFRRNMPAPETVLWQKLRGKVTGVKFRRQFSIKNYILDFYAPSVRLAIEVDGQSHYRRKADILKDRTRDRDLELNHGIRVIRFTNDEVVQNLEGVYAKIIEELTTPSSSPPIRPRRTGGEKIE